MTDAEKQLAKLEIMRKIFISPFYQAYKNAVEAVVNERGTASPFQVDGVVFSVVSKKGTWVDFSPYDVIRTRILEGPVDKYSLPKKDAEAAGFEPSLPDLDFHDMCAQFVEIGVAAIEEKSEGKE